MEKTAEYALTGAKVKEKYGNAELNYKYDARGNLIYEKSSLDNKSFINEYTYDGKNFLNSFKYKNDNTQVAENTYTYTAKGQLEKVYENGNQVVAYSYDLNGNLEKTTYGNNVVTAYDYNYAGLVKSVQSKNGTTVLDSHSYTYYNDGNQKTKTDNGVITTYVYDLYGRLISETAGKEKKNYTYDLSGNRTRLSVSGSENYNTYYNYDAYNRLTRETTNEKGKAERDDNNYYYDFNGNQTLMTYDKIGNSSSGGKFVINNSLNDTEIYSRTFKYNGFNELTHVRGQGNDDISYFYRPDGLMFKRSESDDIYYSWQGNNIIAETDGHGANKVYTRGLGLIKSRDGYYYLLNGHGDISALANSSGTVTTRYTYDAFGNQDRTGAFSNNPFGYCGEYKDYLLNSIYLRARIYNPGTGRFTTEDPARDGLNWYAYCGNNPIMFVDPFGLEQLVVSGGAYGKNRGYKYNFIEPAIKDLYRLVAENKNKESITWLVADEGWTNQEKERFTRIANGDLKISLKFFSSASNLITYLNEGGGNRKNNPITKFIVYSHRFEDYVSFGYNYSDYNENLDFDKSYISKLKKSAFKNANSRFESCNTGTGNNSFAAAWKNQVGGTVWAYEGKSSYENIMYSEGYSRIAAHMPWTTESSKEKDLIERLRKDFGFSRTGSLYLPKAGDGATRRRF